MRTLVWVSWAMGSSERGMQGVTLALGLWR